MNSSQDRNLAIKIRVKQSGVLESGSTVINHYFLPAVILSLALTLQSCSLIEGVVDGSAFSEPATVSGDEVLFEVKDEDSNALDKVKISGIKDLKTAGQPSVHPLKPGRKVLSDESKELATSPSRGIEIMWQIPTEPVEAYHIYLLSGPVDLKDESKHFRVLVSSLKKEDDPTYGPVYKYQVPANLTVNTIQIRAENRFGISDPSEPIVVQK